MKKSVALVTGASGGLGSAIATTLAEEGFKVLLHYKSSEEKAKKLKETLLKSGYEVSLVQGDLTYKDDVLRMVEKAIKTYGRIDVLVNNAGALNDAPIDEMADEAFDEVMSINVKGPWQLTKAVVPHMKKHAYGRIVNISSGVGGFGAPNKSNYGASKGAINTLTKSLSKELGPFGITVNAVAPGLIETDMTNYVDEATKNAYINRIPRGKLARPKDVAYAVKCFSTEDASMISGQIIGVNGGLK
jgi:3-oxoacyl-[acyl-carrier protein] reductase